MTGPQYLPSNAWPEERRRLAALEEHYDPGSIRLLRALGVAPGWRCLEVGAGGGSIAAWLCEQVGASGRVVATDIDTRFVEQLAYPQLEVRRHDITADPLEADTFDLVHARAVLTHFSGRAEILGGALRKLVAALKPGGVLLLAEPDNSSLVADPRAGERFRDLLARYRDASVETVQAAGGDLYYGRRLYGDLCALGLEGVDAEGRSGMVRGGSPVAALRRLTLERLRERLIATGRLTADEVDELRGYFDSPEVLWLSETGVAAWGRRPPA
jgi:SAM-dependent methyltransferase